MEETLDRVLTASVPVDVPTPVAADEQHARVIAGTVVVQTRRRLAFGPTDQIVLVRVGSAEERADRVHLLRAREVRRARYRDLPIFEFGGQTGERQCL
jgi:hypothetical protein